MKTITIKEFHDILDAQNVSKEQEKYICPVCGTIQCAKDLIDAGAGKTYEDVEEYIAFTCIGRFTKNKGCDWTLGGFLNAHKCEVVTDDGEHHPIFEPVGLK